MAERDRSLCLISWLKAMMGDDSFYEEALKLTYLWFDDVVLQSPTDDFVARVFPAIFERYGVTSAVSDELLRNIHPIQYYLPEYKFLDMSVWENDSHVTNSTFIALRKHFEEANGIPSGPQSQWEMNREVAWTTLGVVDAFNLVGRLSKYGESFTRHGASAMESATAQ